jgi:hypothetical protein
VPSGTTQSACPNRIHTPASSPARANQSNSATRSATPGSGQIGRGTLLNGIHVCCRGDDEAVFSERRFGNRRSMCPYKRPYNSGTIRIRLLPPPSVIAYLTSGKRPVGYLPAPSFPASFRFPKPCAQVRILPGSLVKSQFRALERPPTNPVRYLIYCNTLGGTHRVSA